MRKLILPLLILAADQLLKCFVRQMSGPVQLIPGVIHLTHAENSGAAFSLLADHPLLLTVFSTILGLGLIVWAVRWVRHSPDGIGSIAVRMMAAGAAGNLIDRLIFGTVTDMFAVDFMRFAIFNLADASLVIGCALLFVTLLIQKEEAP